MWRSFTCLLKACTGALIKVTIIRRYILWILDSENLLVLKFESVVIHYGSYIGINDIHEVSVLLIKIFASIKIVNLQKIKC